LVHFAVSRCLFKSDVTVSALQENEGIYSQLVKDLVTDKSKRLLININDLRRKNPVRAARLVCLTSVFVCYLDPCRVAWGVLSRKKVLISRVDSQWSILSALGIKQRAVTTPYHKKVAC